MVEFGGINLSNLGVFFGAVFAFAIIIFLALYVYMALVWSTIAKKLKYKKPWLAWIPIANLFLLPILAKKRWEWGFIYVLSILMMPLFYIGGLVIGIIAFALSIWWLWIIFERRKYPGWLALVSIGNIIPFIGFLFGLAFLVILGLVAWSDRK